MTTGQYRLDMHGVSYIRHKVFVGKNKMRIGPVDNPIIIQLKKLPSPQQTNLLHILGENPNRIVNIGDICSRLNIDDDAIAIHLSRLRRCLTEDWTIQNIAKGYRLIDLRDK